MTTHHPKFFIHTALRLTGLTTEKLLPTALKTIRKQTEGTKLNNYNLVRCQARHQRTVDNKLEQELFREAPAHVRHMISFIIIVYAVFCSYI